MEIVSYAYRQPVTSSYRHTKVVGTAAYNTSDRPYQSVNVPTSYYTDYSTPVRSTVSTVPDYSYTSRYPARRYSVSLPTISDRYRQAISGDSDLYYSPRTPSRSYTSYTPSYRTSSAVDYYTPRRGYSSHYDDDYNSSWRLGRYADYGYYGDYNLGYYRPTYCPSTALRYFLGDTSSSYPRSGYLGDYGYSGTSSALVDSLSLASPYYVSRPLGDYTGGYYRPSYCPSTAAPAIVDNRSAKEFYAVSKDDSYLPSSRYSYYDWPVVNRGSRGYSTEKRAYTDDDIILKPVNLPRYATSRYVPLYSSRYVPLYGGRYQPGAHYSDYMSPAPRRSSTRLIESLALAVPSSYRSSTYDSSYERPYGDYAAGYYRPSYCPSTAMKHI